MNLLKGFLIGVVLCALVALPAFAEIALQPGYVLVLVEDANPADRALLTVDRKTPVTFPDLEACTTKGRIEGLKLKAARIPVSLLCKHYVIDNGIVREQ
jgi:hypothetical protein